MDFNGFGMTKSIVNGVEGLYDIFSSILLGVVSTGKNQVTY